MTPEENRRRAEDPHVKYIKEHLCDKDGEKPFVFISYKSDDWEIVLHDIVYRLVKDYGLNVYFDGSFDSHNSLWINQFPENMEHYNCMGVLSFVDDKYASSYATLLELMYSQTKAAGEKNVVQINIGKLTKINGAEGAVNTGLGVKDYEDGTTNVNAQKEEELFVETFEQLVDRGILKDAKYLYKKGKALTKKICSEIVKELLAYLEINENYYEGPEGDLEGIVDSIKDAFDNDVFGDALSDGGEIDVTDPPIDGVGDGDDGDGDGDPTGGDDIADHSKTKKRSSGSIYTFICDGERFERKKLKEMMLIVFKHVLIKNTDKVNHLIEILPCLGEGNRISKEAKPTVFRAGAVFEIEGRQISIGTSLNEKTVLDYIGKLIENSGEKSEIFKLEQKVSKADDSTVEVPKVKMDTQPITPGVVTGPVSLDGKTGSQGKKASADIYSFELYGTRYEGKKLKEMMLTVFKQVLPKHPDKLNELLSVLPCLGEGKLIQKDAKPSVFRQGETISIDSRQISIGTSLGRNSVIGYIGKLMRICGETKDSLKIDHYEY